MNIGIIKLGKYTYSFTDKQNTNESRRSGDIDFQCIGFMLRKIPYLNSSSILYYLSPMEGSKVINKKNVYNSSRITLKSYTELCKDVSHINTLVIYLGPTDSDLAKYQIRFLRQISDKNPKLYIICISGDPRFMSIPGVEHQYNFNQIIKPSNGILPFRFDYFSVLYSIEQSKVNKTILEDKIILIMNEVNTVKSRANRAAELLDSVYYPKELYGKWTDTDSVSFINPKGQLHSSEELHSKISTAKYGLIINSQVEFVPDNVELLGGVSNFIPTKYWEYVLNGCLPIVDIRNCEPNKFMPRDIQISSAEEINTLISRGEQVRQGLLRRILRMINEEEFLMPLAKALKGAAQCM